MEGLLQYWSQIIDKSFAAAAVQGILLIDNLVPNVLFVPFDHEGLWK